MGIIRLKPYAQFRVIAPGGMRILEVLKQVVASLDFDVTITSGTDGLHSGPDDPHYSGEAYDLRTHDLTTDQKRRLLVGLQDALYKDPRRFYAFLEAPDSPNEHIHCQRRNGTIYTLEDYFRDA